MIDYGANQPLNVFFDLQMGSLSETFRQADIPIECTVKMKEVIEFQVSFLDLTGFMVEPHLWESAKQNKTGYPKGSLQWGFTQPDERSEMFPIEVPGYTVKFRKNAFGINVYGTVAMAPLGSSNPMHGTIQEICEKIQDLHEIDVEIDPPFDPANMQDCGYIDLDETEMREMKHLKLAHESDWRYLQRVLQYAMDGENKGNYRAFLTADGGKPLLKICRPNEAVVDRSYKYVYGDPDGPVLEFDPDLSFSNVYGAFDTHVNSFQRITGDTHKAVLQPNLTQGYQVTFGKSTYPLVKASPVQDDATELFQLNSETIEDAVKSRAMRSRTGGSVVNNNRALNQHLREAAGLYTARLQLMGDPTLKPPLIIDMRVPYPSNYGNKFGGLTEHYTSGKYMCFEVHHEIKIGSYTTTLFLERAGSDMAESPSEANA